MERKKIVIGDYMVQQAGNRHISIVYMPEKHLVFHAEVNHECTEDELKEYWEQYKVLRDCGV